jgi:alpha-L-rhamnosidase
VIAPQPGGKLTSARAELLTQYGSAASGWKIEDGQFHLDVRVPPNTRATVRLPGATLANVTEGVSAVGSATGVTSATQDGDVVVVEVGSGDYKFKYPKSS